jgi:NTP pyrophosphatase (non-canonical NTP hydrolase)
MEMDHYQDGCLRTAGQHADYEKGLAILALGVAGEAGEVADDVKKVIGHGHPPDQDRLVAELGDVLWYVAVLAAHIGIPLSEIARRNIEKLRERYPEGFCSQRSMLRTK